MKYSTTTRNLLWEPRQRAEKGKMKKFPDNILVAEEHNIDFRGPQSPETKNYEAGSSRSEIRRKLLITFGEESLSFDVPAYLRLYTFAGKTSLSLMESWAVRLIDHRYSEVCRSRTKILVFLLISSSNLCLNILKWENLKELKAILKQMFWFHKRLKKIFSLEEENYRWIVESNQRPDEPINSAEFWWKRPSTLRTKRAKTREVCWYCYHSFLPNPTEKLVWRQRNKFCDIRKNE